jgi:hypothetical protein
MVFCVQGVGVEDVEKLLQCLSGLSKRHARLVTLLHKLHQAITAPHHPTTHHAATSTHPLATTPLPLADITINKVSAATDNLQMHHVLKASEVLVHVFRVSDIMH